MLSVYKKTADKIVTIIFFVTTHDFIFSNKFNHRLVRHLSLWVCFSAYFFIVNFFPGQSSDFYNPNTYLVAFQKMIYIPISILSVYVSIYFLLPRYLLKEKYFSFFILFICLSVVNLASAFKLTEWLALITQKIPFEKLPLQLRVFQPIIYGLGLSTVASVLALIIKLLKVHHLKKKEYEKLQQQKINIELRMIKPNFHPNFLPNALQNISHLIRNHSTKAPEAVLNLSDLLSYTLYDNEKDWVPMKLELQMVKDYLKLEKILYDGFLTTNVQEAGDITEMRIAPLTLFFLVQNLCEQSLLSMPDKTEVNINIEVQNGSFVFELSCSGFSEISYEIANQTNGLSQALKRIQIIYPGKHSLGINFKNSLFSIQLILEPEVIYERPLNEQKEKALYAVA